MVSGCSRHKAQLQPTLLAAATTHPPLTFLYHTSVVYHKCSKCLSNSVREVFKNSTPPTPLPRFLGGRGVRTPKITTFSKKSEFFFLNFIFPGHFGTCRLKFAFLEHILVKTGHFWHKNEGGYLCSVDSCGVIAVTEGLPPPQSIYTGIRGARIIKKRKF